RADLADEIVRPGLDVALRAALHQQHERAVAETTEQVARLARLGDQTGELPNEFFDRQRTELVGQRIELVRLNRHELADARLDRLRQLLLELLHEEAPLQRAGRSIALQRISELLVDRAGIALLGRDAQAHRRLAVEVGWRQLDLERHSRAVSEHRARAQRMIRPLALQTRDQRALDRGVRFGIERIHQR